MNEKEVLKIFKDEKAYLTGHFLLSSGLHSPGYMQCALLLQKPWIAEKVCRALAKKISGLKIDTVISPALGGIFVSHEVGRALKKKAIFAERLPAACLPDRQGQAGVDGSFTLRRGFDLKKNERVLVVEDVITTGKSCREVIELVDKYGAKTQAVAAIVDRSGVEGGMSLFGQDFYSLLKMDIQTYKPEQCPLCREGKVPLVKPGSRGLK